MSDVIKTLEKNIETLETLEKEYEKKAGPRMKYVSVRSALNNAVISLKKTRDRYSEELAKEQQEEPNIPLECVDGSCPMALSEEYVERGMDVVHSCAECQYQPQVQLIVRTPEEVVEMLNKISCPECDKNSSHCHFSEKDCKNYWFEWLTKSEV